MGKALDKQIKTIEEQGEKQVAAIKSDKKIAIDDIIPKSAFSNGEANDELNKIKELEENAEKNYSMKQKEIHLILEYFKQ